MGAKGMLCGGNTGIMCGACDMGTKSLFCRTHFFSPPPPRVPGKNVPPGIKIPPPLPPPHMVYVSDPLNQ